VNQSTDRFDERITTVIVVEDEDYIRSSLVRKVQNSGHRFKVVGSYGDGRSALEALDQRCPDILITDIRMPVMDGLELLRRALDSHPELNSIVVSGYDDFDYARRAIQFQAKAYLLKPVKQEELNEALFRISLVIETERDQGIGSFAESVRKRRNAEELVMAIQTQLRTNYAQPLSLSAMAADFGFSAAYLTKVFSSRLGYSPSRYLTIVRINAAKNLLRSRRDLSVAEVAELSGYSDQFYFSRVFKQETGLSPLKYRNEAESP